MYKLLRPALFQLPPHAAHELAFLALSIPEHIPPLRRLLAAIFQAPGPRVQALGLSFPNPIGLAGGFDKDGRCPLALAALGFGFVELGTVTAQPQKANPPPNLFRLPMDRALLNRLGFPNRGAAALARRLRHRRPPVPVAISIGKSRNIPVEDLDAVIADYSASFDAVSDVADLVVINISSPNTANLRAIQRADIARVLLSTLIARRPLRRARPLPLLLKVAPDLSREDYEALLDVVDTTGLDGVVATNTTVSREGLRSPASWVASLGAGGISGPPLRERARTMIALARHRLPHATLIGVGGISSVDHARAMLDAGANLLQLYTGFIYEGPSLPGHLARGLLTSPSPPIRLHSRLMGTGHTHHHRERRAWGVVLVTLTMMSAELVVGYLSRSMALTADGWHMGTHALALTLTALAYWYARTRAT
ncbi:MAG: quinone-dependent dihydroorotate dehydrogenase, partial [Myxococcales bacterium]|nr:quinone-dependent dihydroorotate dehydrogenase [Myxococcales bacterium]